MSAPMPHTPAPQPTPQHGVTEWRCLVLAPDGTRDWRRVYALSDRHAAAQLSDEGLLPIEIVSGRLTFAERLAQPVGNSGGMGVGDQALILTQLSMLLHAGMPIDRSLDLLREQMPRVGQRLYLGDVLGRVKGGEPLASALGCRPVFPSYVTGVVGAAEQSGSLTRALAMLAERTSELAQARRELITALSYPAAVFAATIIALTVVVVVVIPQFRPLFEGEEARLPTLTRWVLAFSDHAGALAPTIAITLIISVIAARLWLLSDAGGIWLTTHAARIPGMTLRDQFLAARFATVLGTLLDNGVPLVRALPLVREALSSRRWRAYCSAVEQMLREGSSITRALSYRQLLPGAAVRLAEVGERSGRLGEAFSEAGKIMHAGAKARLDRMVALANPIAITLLGGMVAMLVGGVMLGIFALGEFSG